MGASNIDFSLLPKVPFCMLFWAISAYTKEHAYGKQADVSKERVGLATAYAIHYGLNTGMVIHYLNGEYYTGKSRNADAILAVVSPYIVREDCKHIKQIIHQGCPSYLDFKETYKNKHQVLWKGNQQTFFQYPKVTAKVMNKEERNSHVLLFRHRVVLFLPYCPATP